MYQHHFKFSAQPFGKLTRRTGEFFVHYHQDIFSLLQEKTNVPGIIGLFSDEPELDNAFVEKLRNGGTPALTINAFPKLSASTLLYKLNPAVKEGKNKIYAIDAILRQWHEETPSRNKKGKLLILSTAQAMKDNCWDVLGMLLTRAQELNFPLTILLTGSLDQKSRLLDHSGLQPRVHTCLALRSLTCREYLDYVGAQMDEQNVDTSPLTPARVRRMHALTKGHVTGLNKLAHLALLAAWTERAIQVSPRHLRLAAGELLPPTPRGKRLATAGLFASVLFACCGWYFSGAIASRLPQQVPVPASWKKTLPETTAPVMPTIENEVVNQSDAMHQLYLMWGYDASANDALCQNAARVNLMCRQGNTSLQALEQEGYPWAGEIKTGNHLNYAVVAHVDKQSLDLLINNRTWQVSRHWFNQHATGNYTLLHRLTPQGKDEISATSGDKDLAWLDQTLSQTLNEPLTHSRSWTAELAKRTREFQGKTGLHIDGIAGEETLMQLMRATNSVPGVLAQTLSQKQEHETQGNTK